jgi:hypothetical protein
MMLEGMLYSMPESVLESKRGPEEPRGPSYLPPNVGDLGIKGRLSAQPKGGCNGTYRQT